MSPNPRQPKPPYPNEEEELEVPNPLGNPKIINLIRQTCVKLACQKIKEINDVTDANYKRPLIEINSTTAMRKKWLYDTGASITCMSTSIFRSIPSNKRPT